MVQPGIFRFAFPALFKARGQRHMKEGYVAQYAEETSEAN